MTSSWLADKPEIYVALPIWPTIQRLSQESESVQDLLVRVRPSAATGRYESFIADETPEERARLEAYDAKLAKCVESLDDDQLRSVVVVFRGLGIRQGIGMVVKEAFRRLWVCETDEARRKWLDMEDDRFANEFVGAAFTRDTAWALAKTET